MNKSNPRSAAPLVARFAEIVTTPAMNNAGPGCFLRGLACVAVIGLSACGGGGDSAAAGAGGGGGGAAADGSLVFTGVNNSSRTGFTPPTGTNLCLAVKTSFIQVNCLKPGAAGADNLMITYAGALTAGTAVSLAGGGATNAEFITTEVAGNATITKFWGAEAVGTITLTAIDATSATFKLAGISMKADPLGGGSTSTGTILADGSVTIPLK